MRRITRMSSYLLVVTYFRAVLIVSGAERAGHIIWTKQAESETIPLLPVLSRIVLQVFPEMITQCVLRIDMLIEDAAEFRVRPGDKWKGKRNICSEPDNENALAVLRNEILRIY